MTRHFIILLCTVILYSLSACARQISYYDVISYKNLTDLSAETRLLTDDCVNKHASGAAYYARLSHLRLMSAQALEYEKGKSVNENTIEQLKLINKSILSLHDRFGKNWMVNGKCVEKSDTRQLDFVKGCLKPQYCANKMQIMEKKFRIAIETESLKIKQK
jgi:hypothetical protein